LNDPPRKSGPERVRFEGFEADLHTEELSRAGGRLRLPHQSFQVLAMLLDKAGELVTREELRARLWPAGTLVEYDQRLNAAVNRLREALGDSAEAPRFIETLPKRGYRFIAAIDPPAPSPPVTPDRSSPLTGGEAARAPEANIAGSDGPGVALSGSPGLIDKLSMQSRPPRSRRKVLFAAAIGLSVILTAVTISMLTDRSLTGPPFGRQVVPFTSLPGREIAPTFSPDGNHIAFAWNEGTDADHQFDLYVKSLGSERLLRLTHHPSRWISPAWSPDGSAIAFVRQLEQYAGIFVIPALGGSERNIVSNGLTVGSIIQISWSPDGHQLAYSAYGPTGVPRVYLVSLQTLNTQPLLPAPKCLAAVEPAFSPDGKQLALACISGAAVYTIYVVGLPDGPVRPLASMLGEPQGLAWAADGSRLIFSNDPGDGGELWQLTLDGRLEQLPFGEDGSAPAVAARSGRMAYVRGRKTVDIWRADLTAVHPEESAVKLIYSTRTQAIPRYSSDGAHIAFQSNRSGSVEVWMTDAQGADPDRLTSFNGPFISAPSWCSDGRRIAFDARVSGIPAIYIEDISERVPRKLLTSPGSLSRPVWSQDCRWLFASDAQEVLYRVPSAGGQAERFTGPGSSYDVVVADRLIFNVLEAKGVVLWSKPTRGGPQAPLEGMPRVGYDDAWAATNAGIYYTDSSSTPISVNFYEFASRTRRTLMTLREAPIPGGGPGVAVSPDGRWLLYSQSGDEQSEIMLVPGR
jgi:Tol biopolymer transport system component/DNA-binding winged helix-turn-helix (wHTH) protein